MIKLARMIRSDKDLLRKHSFVAKFLTAIYYLAYPIVGIVACLSYLAALIFFFQGGLGLSEGMILELIILFCFAILGSVLIGVVLLAIGWYTAYIPTIKKVGIYAGLSHEQIKRASIQEILDAYHG